MTIETLIRAAIIKSQAATPVDGKPVYFGGRANFGRYGAEVVKVGRPSTGLSSEHHQRIDFYLDGKRVKRSVVASELEAGR